MLQFMSGCGAGGNVSSDCDTVAFVAQKNSDSISFPISKGGTGVAKAKVVLMVPSQYRDTAETAKLQHMLAAWLTSSDTIVSDGNLATMCVAMLLSRFDNGEVYEIDDVNSDFEVLDNDRLSVDMNVDVAPCFNAQSLLSVCRTSTTRYNNEEPSTEHTFYNVNLATMKRITLDSSPHTGVQVSSNDDVSAFTNVNPLVISSTFVKRSPNLDVFTTSLPLNDRL